MLLSVAFSLSLICDSQSPVSLPHPHPSLVHIIWFSTFSWPPAFCQLVIFSCFLISVSPSFLSILPVSPCISLYLLSPASFLHIFLLCFLSNSRGNYYGDQSFELELCWLLGVRAKEWVLWCFHMLRRSPTTADGRRKAIGIEADKVGPSPRANDEWAPLKRISNWAFVYRRAELWVIRPVLIALQCSTKVISGMASFNGRKRCGNESNADIGASNCPLGHCPATCWFIRFWTLLRFPPARPALIIIPTSDNPAERDSSLTLSPGSSLQLQPLTVIESFERLSLSWQANLRLRRQNELLTASEDDLCGQQEIAIR